MNCRSCTSRRLESGFGYVARGARLVAIGGLLATGLPCLGDSIVERFNFDRPAVSSDKAHQAFTIKGLDSYGAPGAPVLPVKPVKILLPRGQRVSAITVRSAEAQPVGTKFQVKPGSHRFPISRPDLAKPVPPDAAIYQSDEPYPRQAWTDLGVSYKHGWPILMLNLHPVMYRPTSGAVAYLPWIEVKVRTEAEDAGSAALAPRSLHRRDLNEIARLVANPDLLATAPLARDDGAGSLVLIVPPAFVNPFAELVQLHRSEGMDVTVVTTDWIYQNYPGNRPDGGVDDATRVRNYIIHAYQELGARHVLLGGDADGTAQGPEREAVLVPRRGFSVSSEEAVEDHMPADMYFGCLDGSFDHDADGFYGEPNDGPGGGDVDMLFEVHVGRVAVDSAAEIQNLTRKYAAYRAANDVSLARVLMVGEFLGDHFEDARWAGDSKDWIKFGHTLGGRHTVGFLESPLTQAYAIDTLYDRDWPTHDWPAGELVARIEGGVHLVNHLGHSNVTYVMKLGNDQIDAIQNDFYFFGYSQGCYPGAFDNRDPEGSYLEDCACEHLTLNPTGAVAFVGNTRFGWGATTIEQSPSQRYDIEFWHAVLGEHVFNPSEANDISREMNTNYARADPIGRWVFYELTYFGDPALQLRLRTSRGWLAADPAICHPGEEVLLSLVDADLDIDPANLDTAAVTLSCGQDRETVALGEVSPNAGVFRAAARVAQGGAVPGDGIVQAAPPAFLEARYDDADDGTGAANTVRVGLHVVAPLRLKPLNAPDLAVGEAASLRFEAEGGCPPYRFSAPASRYAERLLTPGFTASGTGQGWHGDDRAWDYALPFAFPFYGAPVTSVVVSTNGYLELGQGNPTDAQGSAAELRANRRIAAFWCDLVTDGSQGDDIFVQPESQQITFRWRALTYSGGNPVNVAIRLHADGSIRFSYGAGNAGADPTVGISAGDGERYLVSAYNGQSSLGNVPDVEFTAASLPPGLSLDLESGGLSGVPELAGDYPYLVTVEDLLGVSARGEGSLRVVNDYLRIVAPAAGEHVSAGRAYPVRWESQGALGDTVSLSYNTDGSTAGFPNAIATGVRRTAGTAAWQVPGGDAATCRIQIVDDANPSMRAVSSLFSVLTGPGLFVVSPRGGEVLVEGSSYDIRWETVGDVAQVRVAYSTDGSVTDFPHVIAEAVPNVGSLAWLVPPAGSATCRLQVAAVAIAGVASVSPGDFAIVDRALRVTTPSGGETLQAGATYRVSWENRGAVGDRVSLAYATDGSATVFPLTIAVDAPNTGWYLWDVPTSVSATCRLRVAASGGFSDACDGTFAIAGNAAPRVLIWSRWHAPTGSAAEHIAAILTTRFAQLDLRASDTLDPSVFELELADRDAAVFPHQELVPGGGQYSLGVQFRNALASFLRRGGAVVLAGPRHEELEFAVGAGLVEEIEQTLAVANAAWDIRDSTHPLVAGVAAGFVVPGLTAAYEASGEGEEVLASSTQGATLLSRDAENGRVVIAGTDFLTTTAETETILANAILPVAAPPLLRFLRPAAEEIVEVGHDLVLRWLARNLPPGNVLLAYNTDGSSTSFPSAVGGVPSGRYGGEHAFSLPEPPPDGYFTCRFKICSSDGGLCAVSDQVHVVFPLAFDTETLPVAFAGRQYAAEVRVRGGVPPCELTVGGSLSCQEEVASAPFPSGGTAQGWGADDSGWAYRLPFAFPFFDRTVSDVSVGSNGYLELGQGLVNDYSNSVQELIDNCRIAVLWDDLITEEVFVQQSGSAVVFRWQGTPYDGGDPVNVAVELRASGDILFHYGPGNRLSDPTIGISSGTGQYVISRYNASADLNGAQPLRFYRVSFNEYFTAEVVDGRSLLIRGAAVPDLSAIPFTVSARDVLGTTAERQYVISVEPGPLRIVRPAGGEYLVAGTEDAVAWASAPDVGDSLKIEYNTDGSTTSFPNLIAAAAPNVGSFPWSVPATSAAACRMRLTSVTHSDISVMSGAFRIGPPTFLFGSPPAGAVLCAGRVAHVEWDSVGSTGATVSLAYNTDGSESAFPFTVATGVPNGGDYLWAVPDVDALTCRLRIASESAPGTSAVSPLFSIRQECGIRVSFWMPFGPSGADADVMAEVIRERMAESEISVSYEAAPEALEGLLSAADALVLPPLGRPLASYGALGVACAARLQEFLARGGRVIVFGPGGTSGPSRACELLSNAGLLSRAVDLGQTVQGQCQVAEPGHPLAANLPAQFDAPAATGALELRSPGLRTVVELDGYPILASVDVLAGRVTVVSFDFASRDAVRETVLMNCLRPVLGDVMEVRVPEAGRAVAGGRELRVAWFARGLPAGDVGLWYNTDGSTEVFPYPIGTFSGGLAGGDAPWTPPAVADGERLACRIKVASVADPTRSAVSPLFHVATALSIAPTTLPSAYHDLPYRAEIDVRGGLPGYRCAPAPLYTLTYGGSGISVGGQRVNNSGDDWSHTYRLRFPFPFFGAVVRDIKISSNGYIELGAGDATDYSNSPESLAANRRIAVLWDDLSIGDTGGEGIFVQGGTDSAGIRWRGTVYSTGLPVHVAAVLHRNGDIELQYGGGNAEVTPTVGISQGDATAWIFPTYDGMASLANRDAVRFLRGEMLEGLSLSGLDEDTWVLSGFPGTLSAYSVRLACEDSGQNELLEELTFTVETPELTMTAPLFGSAFAPGEAVAVRWTGRYSGGALVELQYNDTGSTTEFPYRLATVEAGRGEYLWDAPPPPEPGRYGHYFVRACFVDAPLVCAPGGAEFVVAEPMHILPESLPAGMVGAPYYVVLNVTGGVPPYTFLSNWGLPPGLRFDLFTNEISGAPRAPFDGDVGFTVADVTAVTASRTYHLVIGGTLFLRGDTNQDGTRDIADAICALGYLFGHGLQGCPRLRCVKSADTNDDGNLNIADPIYLLSFLFARGAEPPPPFGACGADLSQDLLPCDHFDCP